MLFKSPMLMRVPTLALLLAGLNACSWLPDWCPPPRAAEKVQHRYEVRTTKPYDDVLAELQIAIAEHNFRLTGHNKIGSVIRKREGIRFPDFDAVQFCNLTLARKMLQISPAAVRYMPCNVTLHKEGNKTVIGTNLLPEDSENADLNRFFQEMNDGLRKIVDFAAEE